MVEVKLWGLYEYWIGMSRDIVMENQMEAIVRNGTAIGLCGDYGRDRPPCCNCKVAGI